MKLQLKKLGALQDVTLEPKPLTIICGKNNTGKTYAMYSLWSLIELSFNVDFEFPELQGFVKTIRQKGEVDIHLPDFFEKNLEKMVDAINILLPNTLPRSFNTSKDFFENTEISLKVEVEEFLDYLKNDFDADKLSIFKLNNLFNCTYNSNLGLLKINFKGGREFPLFIINDYLTALFSKIILSKIGSSAFLLPTERAGLNLFFDELKTQQKNIEEYIKSRNSKNKNNIETEDIEEYFATTYYSLPIENYINFISKAKIDYDNGSELFEDLKENFSLMSSFKFKKEKGKVFFKTEDGKELSLHLASSAIKTNFALWVYLSQEHKQSSLLMIDEPELNLHPDAQRLMARLIVYLVNQGIKIAVSTHSDYFIKEINSLIMLKNDFQEKNELINRYGYRNFDNLDITNVVAYHFKDGTAEKMLVDQKSGIQADTFDDVSNTLNAAYNDIYWAINENDIVD